MSAVDISAEKQDKWKKDGGQQASPHEQDEEVELEELDGILFKSRADGLDIDSEYSASSDSSGGDSSKVCDCLSAALSLSFSSSSSSLPMREQQLLRCVDQRPVCLFL